MRQHLPPNSDGSSPHAAAMRWASLRDVALVHAETPSSSVKRGVELFRPGVRSVTGTCSTR
eukprot:2997781-Pleurochrysis_carterae.AAC.1